MNKGILHFSSPTCAPCKVIEPFFEKAKENVTVIGIDVSTDTASAFEYGVTALPTIIFIEGDNEIKRIIGGKIEEIRRAIEEFCR